MSNRKLVFLIDVGLRQFRSTSIQERHYKGKENVRMDEMTKRGYNRLIRKLTTVHQMADEIAIEAQAASPHFQMIVERMLLMIVLKHTEQRLKASLQ